MDLNFTGTKRLIFEKSIELFARYTFDKVALRDVAKSVGIRASSIYNHFNSKQEILDTIYAFFAAHYFDERLTVEQIEPVLREGSLLDIIHGLIFHFAEEHDKIMQEILKIVNQRKCFDDGARKIAKEIMVDECIKYGEDVFNRAVEIGRLAPFNTRDLSLMVNYNRHCTYMRWILNPTPEYYMELLQDENRLYEYAIMAITDLKETQKKF